MISSTFSCLLAITLQKCLFKSFAPLLKSDCLTDWKQLFIISPILQRSLPLRVSPTARGFHFRVVQFTFIYIYFFHFSLSVPPKKPWHNPRPWRLPAGLYCETSFRSRTHFIFMYGERQGWNSACQYLIVPGFPGDSWWRIRLTVQETWVWSLGWKIPWRRAWPPSPVFLLADSHGQRSLEGHSPWSRKESDTTQQLNNNNLVAPAPNAEEDRFSTELPWHHWQRPTAHKSEDLFLDSQFCSTVGHVHPQARITLSWLL